MRRKKILFVFYDLQTGGVPTSFSGIFEQFNNKCEIDVMPLSYNRDCRYNFQKKLIKTSLLFQSCYSYVWNTHGLFRIWIFLFKIVVKCCLEIFHYDISENIKKREIDRIEKKGYELIISFQDQLSAELCSKFILTPKIQWIHFDYVYQCGVNKNNKLILDTFEKLIFVSKYTMDVFKENYPSLTSKCDYVYNLFDKSRIIELSQESANYINCNSRNFSMVTVGRIDKNKRVWMIPEIASQIKKEGIKFNWYIIGKGKLNDEITLKDNISKNDVSDCVHLLGYQNNPYKFIARSSVLVSVSATEACPMIFNEAKILGKPIVTTDFGSAFEFVHDGEDGFISSPENIAKTLLRIINDKRLYEFVCTNAKKLAVDNDSLVEKMEKIFDSVY